MNMTFAEFVSWLLYGGGAGMVVSNALEQSVWFQKQTPKAKWWISKTSIVGFALGIYAIVSNLPPNILSEVDVYFKLAAGALLIDGGIAVYHGVTREPKNPV